MRPRRNGCVGIGERLSGGATCIVQRGIRTGIARRCPSVLSSLKHVELTGPDIIVHDQDPVNHGSKAADIAQRTAVFIRKRPDLGSERDDGAIGKGSAELLEKGEEIGRIGRRDGIAICAWGVGVSVMSVVLSGAESTHSQSISMPSSLYVQYASTIACTKVPRSPSSAAMVLKY